MERVWKGLREMLARKALVCSRQNRQRLWENLVSAQKAKMLIGMQTENDKLRRFQLAMRTVPGTALEAMCVTLWVGTCLHFAHVLRLHEAEFKDDRLINLAEEISW